MNWNYGKVFSQLQNVPQCLCHSVCYLRTQNKEGKKEENEVSRYHYANALTSLTWLLMNGSSCKSNLAAPESSQKGYLCWGWTINLKTLDYLDLANNVVKLILRSNFEKHNFEAEKETKLKFQNKELFFSHLYFQAWCCLTVEVACLRT